MSDKYKNMSLTDLFNESIKNKGIINNSIINLERSRENLKSINHYIYSKCNHEWVLEDITPGPYEKREKICKKCNLYENIYYN